MNFFGYINKNIQMDPIKLKFRLSYLLYFSADIKFRIAK